MACELYLCDQVRGHYTLLIPLQALLDPLLHTLLHLHCALHFQNKAVPLLLSHLENVLGVFIHNFLNCKKEVSAVEWW